MAHHPARLAAGICVLLGVVLFGTPWSIIPGAEVVARWTRPEIALGAGMVLGLAGLTAFQNESKTVSRLLIQLIVVLVGLRIDLGDLVRLGGPALILGSAVVLAALVIGMGLGKVLGAGREVTTLLTSGTAICGGSAIAAVGSAIGAASAPMAVALGGVFILNAAALYLTPVIGDRLGMSSPEFGTWAGLAIHDYSSVLAASRAWDDAHGGSGASALASGAEQAAAVTKAARVLWIAPIAVLAAWWSRRSGNAGATGDDAPRRGFVSPVPWFIAALLIASALRTLLPKEVLNEDGSVLFRRSGLEAAVKVATGTAMPPALFLIGTGLSRATLAAVGWRAFVFATTLWLIIGSASLIAVRFVVRG